MNKERVRRKILIFNLIKSIFFILFFINSHYFLNSSQMIATSRISFLKNIKLFKPTIFNPYILKLNYNKGGILYYGSSHNIDIKHPQFNDIEKRWNKFKPNIAYSEGKIWPLIKSRDNAIKKYGEQGLLRYLAHRDKIKIRCIEPSKRSEIQHLMKFYSLSKIKIYYILRQLIISKEILKRDINATIYVRSLLKNISKIVFFYKCQRSIAEFDCNVKRMLPDLKDWKKIDSNYFMDIRRPSNWLAKINVLVNKFRDKYMAKKIIKGLKKGKRIFAVVGKSHVVNQEDILIARAVYGIGTLPKF